MTHHTRRVLEYLFAISGWIVAATGWTLVCVLVWYFTADPPLSDAPRHGLHQEMPARPPERASKARTGDCEYPTGSERFSASQSPVFIRVSEPGPGTAPQTETDDCKPVPIPAPGSGVLVLIGVAVMWRWV